MAPTLQSLPHTVTRPLRHHLGGGDASVGEADDWQQGDDLDRVLLLLVVRLRRQRLHPAVCVRPGPAAPRHAPDATQPLGVVHGLRAGADGVTPEGPQWAETPPRSVLFFYTPRIKELTFTVRHTRESPERAYGQWLCALAHHDNNQCKCALLSYGPSNSYINSNDILLYLLYLFGMLYICCAISYIHVKTLVAWPTRSF